MTTFEHYKPSSCVVVITTTIAVVTIAVLVLPVGCLLVRPDVRLRFKHVFGLVITTLGVVVFVVVVVIIAAALIFASITMYRCDGAEPTSHSGKVFSTGSKDDPTNGFAVSNLSQSTGRTQSRRSKQAKLLA